MTRIFSLLALVMLWSSFACAQSNSGNTMNAADTGRPTLGIKDDWLFNAASNPLPSCNPAKGRVSRAYVSDQTDTTCTNNVPYVSGGTQGCEVVCLNAALGWRIIGSATSSGGGGALRTVYVNNTASCPGSGTASAQYCTIQNALNNALAGDDIRIQKTASEYVECDSLSVSGTQAHPITIESDAPSNQAILTCHTQSANAQLYLAGTSYVTVQNLTWDGAFNGVPPSAIAANHANGTPSVVNGYQILNNTINGWGASNTSAYSDGFMTNYSIILNESYGGTVATASSVNNAVVSGNTITGGRAWGIYISLSTNALITNNTVTNMVCGTNSGYTPSPTTQGIEEVSGINGWVSNSDWSGNLVQNFTAACSLGSASESVIALHCDAGPVAGTMEKNTVFNINAPDDSSGQVYNEGILIEFNCPNWLVKNNLVNATDSTASAGSNGTGIFVGTADTADPPVLVYNNTVANTGNGAGLRIDTGKGTFKNNILYNNNPQIWFNPTNIAPPPTMVSDYNSLWDLSGGNNVGGYNSFTNVNFATWKTDTGGDSHSLNSTPNMISPVTGSGFNFKLNVGSNAIGAGVQALDNSSSPAVSTDFRNLIRPNPPTIGAYEGAN